MSRALRHDALLGGALALALAPGCSFLFDPVQYATTDASGLGGPDAPTTEPDASAPPEPDAFVPSEVDAALDASAAPDARLDAFVSEDGGPPVRCPYPTSLELPRCSTAGNGLAYCDPASGAIRTLATSVANELVPGARHELGLLGNGVLVAEAGDGDIADLELAREGSRVVAVWLDRTERLVRRRVYTVGLSSLAADAPEAASFGAAGDVGTDVSVRPGHVDQIGVGFVTGGSAAYGECPGSSFGTCSTLPSRIAATGVTQVSVAHADGDLVGVYSGTHPDARQGLFRELVVPGPVAFLEAPGLTFGGLRSTTGDFVYTTGGAGERLVEPMNALLTRTLGGDLPRLVRNDAAGIAREYFVARARLASPGTDVGVASEQVTASAGGMLGCATDCITAATGMPERRIANGLPELRDWSYLIEGDFYRVVVLLSGDTGGTHVAVAMWDTRAGAPGDTVEPMVIGSGRFPTPGDGRAIRAIAQRTASSLEVFVLALVTLGDGAAARDQLYLSGFRLLACGL